MIASVFLNDRIRPVLRDEVAGGFFWSDAELLAYINEGLGELCKYRPESTSVTVSHALSAGCHQALPADGYMLMEIIGNADAGGNLTGRAVRRADREVMDTDYPNWMSSTANAEVRRFCSDLANPRQFFVYPPSNGSGRVLLTYARALQVANIGSDITIDPVYLPALANYVLFKAYNKLSEDVSFANAAKSHAELFYGQTGATDVVMTEKSAAKREPTVNSIVRG